MTSKRLIYLILILLTSWSNLYAQNNGEVKVLARAQKDKVLIRWAPDNTIAWQFANRYGYTLERYTILRDSTLVNPPEKTTLGIFKPLPKEEWENLIDLNDYAAVAAQALYGESFELTENYSSDIVKVINQAKEQEQRFSFALFAADQSFRVAEMCGLAFVDRLARPSEKYLYKVYANVPTGIYPIDSGSAFTGIPDFAPLPQPLDLEALFGDKIVMLKWNREFFEREYNSFIIERSEDNGKSFKRLSKEPIINTFNKENPDSRYFYKMDSIQNYKTYVYRVLGISSFGEIGPPSETVRGEGIVLIKSTAQIVNHNVDNNQVNLQWQFDTGTESLIDNFVLQRSTNIKGPFADVTETLIASQREYNDTKPYATNYYRVGLLVQGRKTNFSFPYLVQLEDSIPPITPVDVTGIIDTTGVVTLSWAANTEQDLEGYRIYRSNFKNAEFAQVTSEPVGIAQYTDTIALKTLSKKIYYKVAAVDFRNNKSDYSELIEITKPDVVPPVTPVFSSVSSSPDGIAIQWTNSSSEDVSSHTLYRKKVTETEWLKIRDFNLSDSSQYLDKEVEPKAKYQYTLVAIDQSGLESAPAVPVTSVQVYDIPVKFEEFNVRISREEKHVRLEWEVDGVDRVSGLLIYRSMGDERLSLYKKVSGTDTEFTDDKLKIDTQYKYRLKAVLADGSYGQWSEELIVAY